MQESQRLLIAAGTARYDHMSEDQQLPVVRADVERIAACFRVPPRAVAHQILLGHRNLCNSGKVKGLNTLPARISKDAVRPPTLSVRVKRSGPPPGVITPSSNSRNSAHGPSFVADELGVAG